VDGIRDRQREESGRMNVHDVRSEAADGERERDRERGKDFEWEEALEVGDIPARCEDREGGWKQEEGGKRGYEVTG
jgi:hypothetical protein